MRPTRKPFESADAQAPRRVNLLGSYLACADPGSSVCFRAVAWPPIHQRSPLHRLDEGFA
jgi:hypothetical protein